MGNLSGCLILGCITSPVSYTHLMMKTRNLIGMIAFCLFALAACTPSKESEKTLTVLSWNVGFCQIYNFLGLRLFPFKHREIHGVLLLNPVSYTHLHNRLLLKIYLSKDKFLCLSLHQAKVQDALHTFHKKEYLLQ